MVQVLAAFLVFFVFKANSQEIGEGNGVLKQPTWITNVVQFRGVSAEKFLEECHFHLTGVITYVDASRRLVVLQDATGAVALDLDGKENGLMTGQWVTIDGTNCAPYYLSFPDYPYRPSRSGVLASFEGPVDWGEYYLTRMRGWVRPPVSGQYSFWIASDNSSELWISSDASPSRIRRVASIPRFTWVKPREWGRFSTQHSELMELKAGEAYYIEVLQEQTGGFDNLSVAWQGPTLEQSVIGGQYLVPWPSLLSGQTNSGILWEYWTNFYLGGLIGMGGARNFESALTMQSAQVTVRGMGKLPNPMPISLNRTLRPLDNFQWVSVEGLTQFMGEDHESAVLEIVDGQATAQIHVSGWKSLVESGVSNVVIRASGVCEGVYDQKGGMLPRLIWVPNSSCITIVQTNSTNADLWLLNRIASVSPVTNTVMDGFFATRGVVTCNDHFMGEEYIYVQEGAAALRVTLKDSRFKDQFKLGHWVEMGGAFEPGKNIGNINPMVVTDSGWHAMPTPMDQPLSVPVPGNRDGRWTELQAVVRSWSTNGLLSVFVNNGEFCLLLSGVSTNELAKLVDARVRVRGVLSLDAPGMPLLLVPSRSFIEVLEKASENPFSVQQKNIAELFSRDIDYSKAHRVRIAGEVTWCDTASFYLQDATGAIRVGKGAEQRVNVGEFLDVAAFVYPNGLGRFASNSVIRSKRSDLGQLKAKGLDFGDDWTTKCNGTLVSVKATLLSRVKRGSQEVFELQQKQRLLTALLTSEKSEVPEIALGSVVQITGVCCDVSPGLPPNLLLRTPGDIVILSNPVWWTWRTTAVLICALLAIASGALLWVHLLRRRLERQQEAQLLFSKRVLERVEEERGRIAANLHDGLGQVLLAIKNHALMAMKADSKEKQDVQTRLKEISGVTSQAIEEVRSITRGLRPYQLDRLGLTQAIRASLTRTSENSAVQFAIRVDDIDNLFDKDSEIHIYRIIQEAVNNIIKHSQATEATVVIKKHESTVSLSIRDNGVGFDIANLASQPHDLGYGLSGIGERAKILGGNFNIISQPGEGSSLSVDVPLRENSL